MRNRSLLPAALLMLGALTLTTACSGDSTTTDSAPASSPGPGTDTASSVDLTKLKGIKIVSDNSADDSCRWATSYPAVPGAAPMTAAMKKDVERRLAAFLGDGDDAVTGCGGPDGFQGEELNISFTFLVASGDVVGVRLSSLDRGAAGDGTETRTYWYDGEGRAAEDALGLIADGSRDAFVAAVKKQLKEVQGADPSYLDATNASSLLDDMTFTPDGSLKADFDRGTVGAPAVGRRSVTLPEATVTPWLSGFGKRVQQQTLDPGKGLDLGATSTPTPTVPAPKDPGEDSTDCAKVKCIALTFDDGPAAPETADLLTHLAQYKARATFFLVGQNAAAHPEIVRAEAKAGHELANHSWNHPDLTRLTTAEIKSQLARTNAVIKQVTGEEPVLFRPPYGAIDNKVRSATTLSPVLWDVDTEDWKYRDANRVAQYVIDKAGRNEVVLLHDIHPTSVAAVPVILKTLTAEGYHFVTVSRLRAGLGRS
jgi:peptidoglycan/xylan/chitin deacetylase (PgdA/CDA1 family)